MKSKIFKGFVEHTRLVPVRHEFKYPLYVYGFDLDELPHLDRNLPLFGYNRGRPVSIHDADYLDERPGSIKEKLLGYLAADGLKESVSSIRLITSARYLNYVFNPVSFYYCLNAAGDVVRMAAEVNNTFGERHVYFPKQKPDQRPGGTHPAYYTAKAFHVSPFNNMEGEYEFMFSPPHEDLDIHIRLLREGAEVFHARLRGKQMPLTAANLTRLILRHPLVPHLTKPRIFMEAARLYFQKHMKYHPKPEPISPMTIKRARPKP
jgi:cyclopropane-fatty-acyl-phospholipid synthase